MPPSRSDLWECAKLLRRRGPDLVGLLMVYYRRHLLREHSIA